ncbi:hypothetical protein H8784_10800 [Parabacteroides acidifaciens]|uniref:NVEALA protein n=1 Tax=Parabacteroides acidifaciens TaxID=2290935 RepID=A0A3D8HDP6_9BACT|nr:NVEALA domain-containing protein [Parabacteroides acidifaciens]MBC8602202.1 hypothetical protein [Parabacteroides acidifaciens]RDU49103.1 hypothetical protein DWU89_11080 [Parabacteroides acidifaciens]
MGKKIIGVIAFAAIAVAAGWNYQQNKQEVELSDLALANVEALARDESGKNNKALAQKSNGEYCCTPLDGNNCTQSPAC